MMLQMKATCGADRGFAVVAPVRGGCIRMMYTESIRHGLPAQNIITY